MSDKVKEEAVQLPAKLEEAEGGLLTEKISRRSFGKLLGAQAVLATAAVSLTACGGGGGSSSGGASDDSDDPNNPDAPGTALTKGAFLATISDYFDWPHSSEYKDRFATAQPTFVDVQIGVTPYAKQIETALEEGVVSNAQGYFYPEDPVTREEAAEMYVKAFKISAATTNPLGGFTDAADISASKLDSVKAIVAAGFMGGTSLTTFSPKGELTDKEAKQILEAITSTLVAPVQVMPKPGTTSPRRYVSFITPTPDATVYLSETMDGSEPVDPSNAPEATSFEWTPGGRSTTVVPAGYVKPYDPWKNGARIYASPDNQTRPIIIRVKAVAKKNGMQVSGVREFVWNIFRNADMPFEAKLVHAATATTPAVWQVYNVSEMVQANAYYIEGTTGGIIFDFLQYTYTGSVGSNEGMKPFVDSLATKPYVGILGHNHGDHVAQIGSFTDNGITMYATPHNKAQLMASSNGGYNRAGNAAIALTDGQVFDLGNCKVSAWFQPGHEDGLVTLIIHEAGWVYATDMWACNRGYTADTTNYSGVKTDLQLSLIRQLWANYLKSSVTGQIAEVTNAHQDFPVGVEAAMNFIQTFQNVIDHGAAATRPSIRAAAGSRMGWIHNYGESNPEEVGAGDLTNYWGMWHDKNWMANELGGTYSATELDCLTKPTAAAGYTTNSSIDYNGADGYKKYSVLANAEITGGSLVGVDVYWNTPANGLDRKLTNKFDPWTYAYTINVPTGTGSIAFKPVALSTKATVKVNGAAVKWDESVTVTASAGAQITVDVVAQDGTTSSSYTFTIALV
ncbi:MAG: cadherin-like beta sandwich domain-containing protein [Candidatus Accumulibacter sp.]|jgi:glyoxylase-like metal-dependent hydrolase (beta-lactamase superfamily II)|nr:cadherin-like beta sandwich domain-containing protein [Accumulibacter sp.]